MVLLDRRLAAALTAGALASCGEGGSGGGASSTSTFAWSSPVLLETDDAGNAVVPRVAVDRDGNATAVWTQSDGVRFNVWANRFDAQRKEWLGAVALESEAGTAAGPDVAVDGAGVATAVWVQDVPPFVQLVRAARFDPASATWSEPDDVDLGDAAFKRDPRVVADPDGFATAHLVVGLRDVVEELS